LDHFSVIQDILYELVKVVTYSVIDISHFSDLVYSSRFAGFLTMLVLNFP